MVPAFWLFVAAFGGGAVGFIVAALCAASKDEQEETDRGER